MDDALHLIHAYRLAMMSADPSTQNGAVLFDPQSSQYIATGLNRFPLGVRQTSERWERPTKLSYVEHAERDCIYNAARRGISTDGAILYCPFFACFDCARAIAACGIREVVGHVGDHIPVHPDWEYAIKVGMMILQEAGVRTRWFRGKLDPTNQIAVMRNGELIHP